MRRNVDPALVAHESAHIVFALTFNVPVESVTVIASEDWAGLTRFKADAFGKADPLRLAQVILAGPIAHRRITGRTEWPAAAGSDLEMVQMIIRAAIRPKSTDFFDQLVLLTEARVSVYWAAIQRVAAELSWKGELPASRVKQLMEAK